MRHKPKLIDPNDFAPKQSGVGRKKKLSAVQSSTVFEAQVQILAMQKLIDRTLEEAGVNNRGTRSFVLTQCWRARGRTDIPNKLLVSGAGVNFTPRRRIEHESLRG